jgi:hypothetical protein
MSGFFRFVRLWGEDHDNPTPSPEHAMKRTVPLAAPTAPRDGTAEHQRACSARLEDRILERSRSSERERGDLRHERRRLRSAPAHRDLGQQQLPRMVAERAIHLFSQQPWRPEGDSVSALVAQGISQRERWFGRGVGARRPCGIDGLPVTSDKFADHAAWPRRITFRRFARRRC